MPEPITPAATRSVIDDDSRQVALIDIREPLDYSEGHIYESTPVPRRDLEVRLPIVVPGGQATIVLIDEAGDRAEDDAEWLEVLGYSDVRYLDGGMAAWVEAGYETVDAHDGVYATAFNFPSKDFGERVEVEDEPEKLSPDEFKALREDQDVLLADVRTPEEFEESTIPGALHIEGVDVGLYLDTLREDDQPVVVHCGGRTRSIIGASTLQKLGFEEVYELENGTMGWDLAGFDLEHGADRHIRDLDLDSVTRDSIRERVADLLEQTDVSYLSAAEFSDLLANDELLYPVDVRTADEYAASHIPGSLSIPGGQAIQTTDEHFAVRNGTVVFISDDGIRAGITAYWFDRMGFPRVFVLEGGLDAWEAAGEPVETGSTTRKPPDSGIVRDLVEEITPAELDQLRSTQDPLVVDVDVSERFIDGHLPGARWVPRTALEEWLETDAASESPIILTSREGDRARYAGAAVRRLLDREDIRVLRGGTAAWAESGRDLETDESGLTVEPRDNVPKPYHQGDWAKRTYLEWEEALGEKYS